MFSLKQIIPNRSIFISELKSQVIANFIYEANLDENIQVIIDGKRFQIDLNDCELWWTKLERLLLFQTQTIDFDRSLS